MEEVTVTNLLAVIVGLIIQEKNVKLILISKKIPPNLIVKLNLARPDVDQMEHVTLSMDVFAMRDSKEIDAPPLYIMTAIIQKI